MKLKTIFCCFLFVSMNSLAYAEDFISIYGDIPISKMGKFIKNTTDKKPNFVNNTKHLGYLSLQNAPLDPTGAFELKNKANYFIFFVAQKNNANIAPVFLYSPQEKPTYFLKSSKNEGFVCINTNSKQKWILATQSRFDGEIYHQINLANPNMKENCIKYVAQDDSWIVDDFVEW